MNYNVIIKINEVVIVRAPIDSHSPSRDNYRIRNGIAGRVLISHRNMAYKRRLGTTSLIIFELALELLGARNLVEQLLPQIKGDQPRGIGSTALNNPRVAPSLSDGKFSYGSIVGNRKF